MKAFNLIIKFLLFAFTVFLLTCSEAKAIQISIYGKAGMTISNGTVKVCPGWAFNRCATIEFTLSELFDYILGKDVSKMPVCRVVLFDENGVITRETFLKIRNIDSTLLDKIPAEIRGESIEFE